MLSGREHEEQAAKLLHRAEEATTPERIAALIAQAQVHATLALAAQVEQVAGGLPGAGRGY